MIPSIRVAAVAALLMAAAGPAAAAVTVYKGEGAAAAHVAAAAFAAAIGPSTVETFEGRADGDRIVTWSYGAGATATLANGFGVTSSFPYGGGPTSGDAGYGAYPDGDIGGDPVLTFSRPLSAFGAYFVDMEIANTLIFTLEGGGTRSFSVPIAGDAGLSFFGVDFGAEVITGLTIDVASYEAMMIDDVRIAANGGAPVPEPGAWALMITGFGAAGAALRRRREAPRPA